MKRLLIADDEDLMLYALSKTFQDREMDVITASNGQTALKAISENRTVYNCEFRNY